MESFTLKIDGKYQKFEYIDAVNVSRETLPDISLTRGGKHKDAYAITGCAFDIETVTVDTTFATMYMWQFAIGTDFVIIGRTWEQFQKLVSLLEEKYCKDCKVIVWVHNLSYEFSFCRKWLEYATDRHGNAEVFATAERKVVYFRTKGGLEFRDSYILTARSLARLPKDYGFEGKCKKLKEETGFDYKELRTSATKLKNTEIAYGINDVLVLTNFHKYYIYKEFIRNDKDIPLTSTGIVRADLKASFKKLPTKEQHAYNEMIRECYPKEDEYKKMLAFLYRGGFVHANKLYTGVVLENMDIGSFDFKSSYPSVMFDLFPYKFIQKPSSFFKKYIYPVYDWQYMKERAFYGTFTFENLRAKNCHSIESKSKCIDCKNVVEDNGRIQSAEYVVVMLNDDDWKNYCDFYDWDKVTCHCIHFSKCKPLPHFLLDIVAYYFNAKETFEKTDPLRNLCKYKLNSCYGMCVTSLFNEHIVLNDSGNLVKESAPIQWDKAVKKQLLLAQWGIWISSKARRNLLSTVAKIPNDVAYCDTDSIKMVNVTNNQYVIDNYNARITRRNKSMYTSTYDRKVFKNLGKFDYEGKYFRLKMLGAKRYIHSEVSHGKLITDATICGLPKGALEDYAQNNIYEMFDFGLELNEEYANKLTASYNDEGGTRYITDRDGLQFKCTEKSCVSLTDTTYKLNVSQSYITLLQSIIEQRGLSYGKH